MTTFIDNLCDNNDMKECVNISQENYMEVALDFSLDLEVRMRALTLFDLKCVDNISEFLKRLINIFSMSMSKIIQNYIHEISINSHFPIVIRLELAKDMSFCKDDDICFQALDVLCAEMLDSQDISTIKKTECVCALMRCKKYRDSSLLYFLNLIDNPLVDCQYRYKTIVSLHTTYEMRKRWVEKEEQERLDEDFKFFDKSALEHFVSVSSNIPTMRILAGQSILVKYGYSEGAQRGNSDVIGYLFSIANDDSVEYNTRADATDVILRYGDDKSKEDAKQLIIKLGKMGHTGEVRTIYENAQNAHGESIEQSAISCFEKIVQIKLIKKENSDSDIDFEYVLEKIGNVNDDAVITINRICMDNALYTKFSCSLKTALVVLYSFIAPSVYYDTLFERLIEELTSSAGICSSGIFERLMNVPSGIIDDMSLTISFDEQITANLTGRLNAKIRGIIAKPCLHISDKRFCNCINKSCIGSKEKRTKIYSRRRKNIDYSLCKKCAICVDKECIHICKETCNEDLCDTILCEMVIPTHEHMKRRTFLLFFNYCISDIMEELREEFKSYIDDATFEMYMQRAIIHYIGDN